MLCSENQNILNKVFFDHKSCEDEEEEEEEKKQDDKKEEDDFLMEFTDMKKDSDIEINTQIQIEENDNKFEIHETPLERYIKKDDDEDLVNFTEKIEESPFEKRESPGDHEEISPSQLENTPIDVDEVIQNDSNQDKPVSPNENEENVLPEDKNQEDVMDNEEKDLKPAEVATDKVNEEQNPEDEEIPENIQVEQEPEAKDESNKEIEKKNIESLNVSAKSINEIRLDTELLDYFFTFLDTEGELNYVLAGYFAKVFSHYLNLRQGLLMRYIFVLRPEILTKLVSHINRKSILECIYKILISFSDDIKDANIIKINLLKSV